MEQEQEYSAAEIVPESTAAEDVRETEFTTFFFELLAEIRY